MLSATQFPGLAVDIVVHGRLTDVDQQFARCCSGAGLETANFGFMLSHVSIIVRVAPNDDQMESKEEQDEQSLEE